MPGKKIKVISLSLILFSGVVLTPLAGRPGEDRKPEKGVVVKLEQCLNQACDQTDVISPRDGLELETTLWDKEKKQGIVVVRERYRAPNRIEFGDLYFDHIAFSPTRKMKSLYDVDRLTLWPKNSKYVRREKAGVYTVRIPRREGTVLLGLTGIDAQAFHDTRIASANLKIHRVPGDAETVTGELKSGASARRLEEKILVDKSGKTPRAIAWTRVQFAGGEGWIKGDDALRPPRVTAVREFLGISISFFGLFAREAGFVRWRNRDYMAFQNVKSGASYTLEFEDGLHRFARDKSPKIKGISWKDYYTPVELAALPAK